MLDFKESTKNSQVLAVHYAKKLGNDFAVEFMSSNVDISNSAEAELIARTFWQMVDLAIKDNEAEIEVEGISDIEFWMHKLFNKVSGYMALKGYEDLWDKTTNEMKS